MLLKLYVNECRWRLGCCFKHVMRIFIPHFSALALTPNIRPDVKHLVFKLWTRRMASVCWMAS